MNRVKALALQDRPVHSWLRQVRVAFLPGPLTAFLEKVLAGLKERFLSWGHTVQETPDGSTDAILTTALFGQPIPWHRAMLFSVRRRFRLPQTPSIYTLIHAPSTVFRCLLDHLANALSKEEPDPADFSFPGLSPRAYRVLFEQGRRGGPLLALERVIQTQAKSMNVLLAVGGEQLEEMYYFNLVGAHPRSTPPPVEAVYEDMVLRIVTTLSAQTVTEHQVVDDPLPAEAWRSLSTPKAMVRASRELGRRHFFTPMVRIADLVEIPFVSDAVASQYSEGCFATWDPVLGGLIATATGSLHEVEKSNIIEDDLAIIAGIRPDGRGALIRHVAGRPEVFPSSEAVEMMEMDRPLPLIDLPPEWGITRAVPVIRSKLHGHRGIAAYDPSWVEFVPVAPPYAYYPVSCATDAQAHAVRDAFARSEALQNPSDPRPVVFTLIPGHGVVIAEKWVVGKAPFQAIWELMDTGGLEVESPVPQGPLTETTGPDGRRYLRSIL